jgi:uncharacterized protein YggE
LGIEDKDLKTTNLSVTPRYQPAAKPNEQPNFLGYTVSYNLNVTVRKLDQMGAVLDNMMEAGANRNMTISFGCSKLDELIKEARVKALAEAREKANLYVTGAGARLGDVLGITDQPYSYPMPAYPVNARELMDAKVNIPVMVGEQELWVTITITWGIDNTHLEPNQ